MKPYRLTPKARVDLGEIWSYIAEDNEPAADRVEQAIYDAFAFLADAPHSGHRRKDLTTLPVRFWAIPRYPKYVIVYVPDAIPLNIIRILHGARDAAQQLRR